MKILSHNSLDNVDYLKNLDRLKMSELLADFPAQISDGIKIGEQFRIPRTFSRGINKIIFVGMGGSAIGGDVIRSLVAVDLTIPIWVSRHYELPPFVDSKTLCIFSSYSGNTEETVAAFHASRRRKPKSITITSGGALAQLSDRFGIPWVRIPSGFPPRAALGYSVFPILKLFSTLNIFKWDSAGVSETVSLLDNLAKKKFGLEVPTEENLAKQIAKVLSGRWVVIYAGTELLDSAALRFRNQIEENAKAIASHHLLPEMNHNEILGWQFPKELIQKTACVFLEDGKDHERIKLRIQFTKDQIAKRNVPILDIHSQGKSKLARIFSTIYLGDWVSFYLAVLYGIDPTPVAIIETLKKHLAKVRF